MGRRRNRRLSQNRLPRRWSRGGIFRSHSACLQFEGFEVRSMLSISTPFTPDEIRQAYGIDKIQYGSTLGDGAGITVAVLALGVDANITSDLQSFDQLLFPTSTVNLDTFGSYTGPSGLPGGSTQPWFNIISDPNVAPSAASSLTGGEISLDVERVHALAPMANILVVQSGSVDEGMQYAASQAGVSVVTSSYFDGTENNNDSDFTAPNVTFLAAIGDSGALARDSQNLFYGFKNETAEYPGTSYNVMAVGGTNLTINNDGSYGGKRPGASCRRSPCSIRR